MHTIESLREKRVTLYNQAKAVMDENTKDGLVTPEGKARFDEIMAEADAVKNTIDVMERQKAIDAQMNQATREPTRQDPAANYGDPAGNRAAGPRANAAYVDAFWNVMRNIATDLSARNALQTDTDAQGGYLVPDEFERILVQSLEDENIFRRLAHRITTSSGERHIPVLASEGEAAWMDEGAPYPEAGADFGQVVLGAWKLGTTIKVSNELLSDSAINLPYHIARIFARRVARKEEEAFFVGDGDKKPTGIFADTGGGQLGTTTAGAAIKFDDVIDLYHSLRAPYRPGAVFVANDSSIKELRKLKDNNGQYLWQPSTQECQPDRLLGRPIHTSPFVPAIGASAKVMAFGDFNHYWVADRSVRSMRRLDELYATTGHVGFLCSQRVDGKLTLPEAIKVMQMAD